MGKPEKTSGILCLTRKPGESIVIADVVEITVVSNRAGKVRLAIQAPKEISVLRKELLSRGKSNAAKTDSEETNAVSED